MRTNDLLLKWAGLSAAALVAVALVSGCKSSATNSAVTLAPDQPSPLAPKPISSDSVPPLAITPPVRISCGATDPRTDSEGNVWVADEGFADGEPYAVEDAPVTNTKDPALFRTERYGLSGYNFGVPNGKYTVKLLFAEIYSGIGGPGGRVFSFDVQGHEFKDFDIWASAGGANKAYIQSVDVDVTNGVLNITFEPKVENPKVDGLEILPRS